MSSGLKETELEAIDGLLRQRTITVPQAGRVLGISRDAAYAAAERGEIPCVRIGRRLVVPVARLRSEVLGETTGVAAS